MSTLLEALAPLTAHIATLDLNHPEAATQSLLATFPATQLDAIRALALQTADLTPKQATPTLSFGRISKSGLSTSGLSIDAVNMAGDGAAHTHPKGEVSLCFALEGQPRFCGQAGPWVVLPPESHHTPSVIEGRMLIFYWLPEGAMTWSR